MILLTLLTQKSLFFFFFYFLFLQFEPKLWNHLPGLKRPLMIPEPLFISTLTSVPKCRPGGGKYKRRAPFLCSTALVWVVSAVGRDSSPWEVFVVNTGGRPLIPSKSHRTSLCTAGKSSLPPCLSPMGGSGCHFHTHVWFLVMTFAWLQRRFLARQRSLCTSVLVYM